MSIMAAMAPCCRLYGFLGLALAAAFPDAQHAYKDWLATYSSAPYLSVPDMQEALMDEVGDEGNYGVPSPLLGAGTPLPHAGEGQRGILSIFAVSERVSELEHCLLIVHPKSTSMNLDTLPLFL